MRANNTQSIGQLSSAICNSKNGIIDIKVKQQFPLTKTQLWKVFKFTFYNMFGKHFIENKHTINNIKTLFFYFLNDPKFFNCVNLTKGINTPDFKKGLLIIGGVGIGKTDYLKVFENILAKHSASRFKIYNAKLLVSDFEKCSTPIEKDYFFKDKDRKRLCIDDIGSENNASNYGIYNVVDHVISNRYDKKLVTHATTNFSSSANDVDETLRALGERYGHRVYDRLFEMFNIIIFTGPSLRT